MTSRRANGEGTRPKKHAKGGYYSHLRVRYADGTRGRETLYGATVADVKRRVADRQRELAQTGHVRRRDRSTVAEFLTRWLRDVAKPGVRPTTYRSYEGVIENHLAPALGRIELAKLSPADVQRALAAMRPIERRRKDGSVIPWRSDGSRTRELALATLDAALDVAVKWDLIARNPAALADKPRVARGEMLFYGPDEIDRLLAARGDDRLGALYLLAIFTGMRSGEILGLRWQDVDLDALAIHVRVQLNDLTRKLEEPKTRSAIRTIDITPAVAAELKAHRARMLAEGHPHGFVFCDTDGSELRASNVRARSWKPLIARAGVKDIRFHDLRHTAATLMLAANVPVMVVSKRMGHASPDYTLRLYGHVLPMLQRDVATRVERFIETARATA